MDSFPLYSISIIYFGDITFSRFLFCASYNIPAIYNDVQCIISRKLRSLCKLCSSNERSFNFFLSFFVPYCFFLPGLISATGGAHGSVGSAGASTSPTKKRAKKSAGSGTPGGIRGEEGPGLALASEPTSLGEPTSGSLAGLELGAPVSAKMRSLPAVRIVEPSIHANYSACPIFGRDRGTPIQPQLAGSFGSGELKKASKYGGDFYKHLGTSTRSSRARRNRLVLNSRGFYNQEFSHRLSSNSDRAFR